MDNHLPIALQLAFDTVVPEPLKVLWRKYLDDRRAMLLEELRTAEVDIEEACRRDEVLAMLIKFFQAMMQGPAFRNLRVIAQVLAYKAAKPERQTEDFIVWADAIGGMLPEEVIFATTLFRNEQISAAKTGEADKQHADATFLTKQELVGTGKQLETNDHYQMVGSALSRTGLVFPVTGWEELTFVTTPRMAQLVKIARTGEWADSARDRPNTDRSGTP